MDSRKLHAPKPIRHQGNSRGVKLISDFEKISNFRVNSHTPKPGKQALDAASEVESQVDLEKFNYRGNLDNLNLKNSLLMTGGNSNKYERPRHRYSKTNIFHQNGSTNVEHEDIEKDFAKLHLDQEDTKSKSEIMSILGLGKNESTMYTSNFTLNIDDDSSSVVMMEDLRISLPPCRTHNAFYKNFHLLEEEDQNKVQEEHYEEFIGETYAESNLNLRTLNFLENLKK
jgi:hypothetical protein